MAASRRVGSVVYIVMTKPLRCLGGAGAASRRIERVVSMLNIIIISIIYNFTCLGSAGATSRTLGSVVYIVILTKRLGSAGASPRGIESVVYLVYNEFEIFGRCRSRLQTN